MNKKSISFQGHHGTSSAAASEILQSNYIISVGDDEWLGDGVYFFVPGLNSNTFELAEKWAIANAWNKKRKQHDYSEYSVLWSNIEVEESAFLDLTVEEGVEIFTYLVEKYSKKLASIKKEMKLIFLDGCLLNLVRKEGVIPIDAVKGNFYIKFTEERIKRLNFRVQNCTICAVYNPEKTIQAKKIVKTEKIKK